MSDPIIVAIITGLLSLIGIVWQSRKTRRINTEEHGINANKIDRIETKIDKVDFKTDRLNAALEDHIESHKNNPTP